ncbi:MAG: UDP-N-acetylglucosamine 1-carboxyvinyltransferase, UDP-N-acetylglucosamine 1-carboxyvinyltransferase [candidate division Kazan bacterium GW2011_GWA1_50_15]|uniref:UDP-N-acetylglucosamine 1-carboxyvinyltransferase n=2 Tax=Bacteria division Kazan-3B-28 TaxID=1798534 RepID=A0A0G1ZFY3_UNCK3|nr:MAG: UDP-N-acetylglucosamine 1-carboxyvinyltransferase, UDP-N-acetylglucosamine 1-carboxyvinyltransferase [candidate division Kazan bacterium GW2011_GWA1_50_15]KKW25501.1 MAG: UDP-N-acetylglucosamine 1-carboxyvinyltransferase [candidate division Kazan bacterium GW2011_GWC1_52_13]KKW26807.1 MAG: UDP-N-acetylglucosamine 1-carboxyvinyltransferase [candidate division Kazan bacterium GW2011_GWB1_52_7]HAV65802.1 UDP-N-acetylglucosamine 1-carboxyvinyltransferase [Patescibacteria group bacterium]HCR
MSKFIIHGGARLEGEITVSGSKNAALPMLAATLLTNEICVVHNVPRIADVDQMLTILRSLGARVDWVADHSVRIDASQVDGREPDYKQIKKIRASVLLIGPLLARLKRVTIPHPGGCHIGARPIGVHIQALEDLGAVVRTDNQLYYITAERLRGKRIVLGEMSVTGTAVVVMAACLAEGTTEIRLAAAEPETTNLLGMLQGMGAKIGGIDSHTLVIEGMGQLHGVETTVIPDRLEAGTLAIAAAITRGDVTIHGFMHSHLDIFIKKLRDANVQLQILSDNSVRISRTTLLKAVNIRTDVYPGFPTDLQAPLAVLLTQANGTSLIFETMFEGRLNYFQELARMGATANILDAHRAAINGPTVLYGKSIESLDIRAGATLILAALIAHGRSEIDHIELIDRGYERIDEKLNALGAQIERIEEVVSAAME